MKRAKVLKTVRLVQKLTVDKKKIILRKIREKSQDDDVGCCLWTRPVKEKKYPKMTITVNGDRSYPNVSSLVYFLSGNLNVPEGTFHISHLCHVKKCVRREHLSLERHYVNKARDTCKKKGTCSGHGELQNCIVKCFILSFTLFIRGHP